MPAQARSESENLGGTFPTSRISLKVATNDEHPSPALRDGFGPSSVHSAILSVNDPVGPPVPEFPQRPEEGTKIPSSVAGQDTGDVFPDNPSRPKTPSDFKIGKHESSSRVVESFAESGNAKGLAGGSAHEKVN
jgi:hypothetical protein